MNPTPSADPPPGRGEDDEPRERAQRSNLLLAATIEAQDLKTAVRIRNLSETGAMLEGAVLPGVGDRLTLRRLDLEVGATVVWSARSRCGVRFDRKISVAGWRAGTWSSPGDSRDQQRVDGIQAAVRAGVAITAAAATETVAAPSVGILDARLAEELAHVRRLIEAIGDELSEEPLIVRRHPRALQGFDMACQLLGHIGSVLGAQDRSAAVNAIGMDDLRARLLRKSLF